MELPGTHRRRARTSRPDGRGGTGSRGSRGRPARRSASRRSSARDDLAHHLGGAGEHIHIGDSRTDARQQLDVVAGDEPVELELPRLPLTRHGPHAADVARVVAVVGCGIHEHELACLELRRLRAVVAVPDVLSGSDDRLVCAPERATAQEDELGKRTQLVLHHARGGRPHRLEHAEAGEPPRLPHQGEL